ncbi:hypothetical protein [Cellulosimicrobium cellulans]|uniref:hypothetical protein n=1 Tax=Cellulosimicrobium cellulans TaxID=1710 RepID=UPI000848E030|nr:hypothetical protein [Cellulosimicrobium cellulans]
MGLASLNELPYAFYLVHATIIYALRATFGGLPTAWASMLRYASRSACHKVLAAAVHVLVDKPSDG